MRSASTARQAAARSRRSTKLGTTCSRRRSRARCWNSSSGRGRRRGDSRVWPDVLAIDWGTWVATALLVYSTTAFAAHLALALLASDEVGRQHRRQLLTDPLHMFESEQAPAISILLPARNDARTIVDAVRALLRL